MEECAPQQVCSGAVGVVSCACVSLAPVVCSAALPPSVHVQAAKQDTAQPQLLVYAITAIHFIAEACKILSL